jgi:hypothetical protein
MAVRNRSTQLTYVDELNTDGVATQRELENYISQHIDTFHNNQSATVTVDGMDFFYDSATNKYLSKQWFNLEYYESNNRTRNIYLYSNEKIRCSDSVYTLPYSKDFLLSKVQVDLDSVSVGNLFSVEDSNWNNIYNINVLSGQTLVVENLNITLPSRSGVLVYNNSTKTDRPRVTLWFRLIHTV